MRLIDSSYKDLYRVPNGGVIQVDYPDGRSFTTRLEHWTSIILMLVDWVICSTSASLQRSWSAMEPAITRKSRHRMK
mgnify:CR=1 FL=1